MVRVHYDGNLINGIAPLKSIYAILNNGATIKAEKLLRAPLPHSASCSCSQYDCNVLHMLGCNLDFKVLQQYQKKHLILFCFAGNSGKKQRVDQYC